MAPGSSYNPFIGLRWTPHPKIVTIGATRDHIKVLLYSFYTTVTGWGVLTSSYLNSRLLGYVTIGYIEPSSHYSGNWSLRECCLGQSCRAAPDP